MCLPLPSLLLICAVASDNSGSIALRTDDFPTPVLPVSTHTDESKTLRKFSIPSPVTDDTAKDSIPAFLYISTYPEASPRSAFEKTTTGSMFLSTAIAVSLSIIGIFGTGSFTDEMITSLSMFATGGLTRELRLS